MRVQIPAYTDRWMRGDRFGEVVKRLPAAPGELCDRYRVKLDKTGDVRTFVADDCTVV